VALDRVVDWIYTGRTMATSETKPVISKNPARPRPTREEFKKLLDQSMRESSEILRALAELGD
jgi:hypothetical protein